MNPPAPKRVLSIQSEVVHGHVGNSAARFALQRLGIDVLALPTVLFSNHPGHGGFRGKATPPEDLAALLDGLEERGFLDGVDAVQSGYLGLAEQAGVVRDAVIRVKRRNAASLYLLDSVFGDEGGAYARPGVAEAMARDLLPLADIVTPNRFELSSLSRLEIVDPSSAVAAARMLERPLVLATSIPCAGEIGTAIVTANDAWIAAAPLVDRPPSGTGDLLAALFLGHTLGGDTPESALGRAAGALDRLIRESAGAKDLYLVAGQDVLVSAPPLTTRPVS